MNTSVQNGSQVRLHSTSEAANASVEVIEAAVMARELMQNYDGTAPGFSAVKKAYYNGHIPGRKLPNGRWVTAREDLDAVAAAFGMKPKAEMVAA